MKQDNCIFCKIIAGEIPSQAIYEDEKFRVILDVAPAAKGHALILPKDHYANLYELPDDLAADTIRLAKKMMKVMNTLFSEKMSMEMMARMFQSAWREQRTFLKILKDEIFQLTQFITT